MSDDEFPDPCPECGEPVLRLGPSRPDNEGQCSECGVLIVWGGEWTFEADQ